MRNKPKSQIIMNKLSSISKLNQKRITKLFAAQHTITVGEAATILEMPRKEVSKLISRWVGQGIVTRIKRGLYVPARQEGLKEDSWLTANKIYCPCYIGAQSAAEYWGFENPTSTTNIYIFTTKKPRNRNPIINNVSYSVRTIDPDVMFGLELIRREHTEVLVSDPARTIIDFLIDPRLGGGIENVGRILVKYFESSQKNPELLFSYAKRVFNGAVLKRLGFLLERYSIGEFSIIAFCKLLLTTGNIKLDPEMRSEKLITRWGLWVPKGW